MDVKTIRDEIAKIDVLLSSVETEIQKITPEIEPDPQLMEQEYMLLLSALSTAGGQPGRPFQSLEADDEGDFDSSSSGLDAFTFFGLLQAFIEDPLVLTCLAKQFSSVVGVTPTQLEDSLVIAERISDPAAQRSILLSIIDRIVAEIEKGKSISNFEIVASVCQRASLLGQSFPNPSLLRLLETRGWENWPLFVQIELAHYFEPHVKKLRIARMFTSCVVDSVVGEDGSQLERNIYLHSPRTCFQLLDLIGPDKTMIEHEKIIAFIEKCVSRTALPIPGQTRLASDWHSLVIRMARINFLNKDPQLPVWTSVVDRLTAGGTPPAFEVSGTLRALSHVGLTNEGLFSNLVAFKKRITAPDLSREDFSEIVHHLILAGDRSTGSAVSKAILERRDLFIPTSDADDHEEVCSLLAHVVLLAAVASVESGSIIPESILILKKFSPQIWRSVKDPDLFVCMMQLLLPSTDAESIMGPQSARPTPSLGEKDGTERVKNALNMVGFSTEAPHSELVSLMRIEGLHVDFAFPSHRIAILVDHSALFNTTSKKHVVSGTIALKANILTQRKGFKVIVIVPQMYPDERSLVSLLADPLRRVAPNAVVIFDSMDRCKLSLNQRVKSFASVTSSFVELARVLYLVLKYSVQVNEFRFENLVCGDQFINLVFAEFLPTYVVKHKHDILVECSASAISSDGLLKLVEALNAAGNASNGFGRIWLKFGVSQDVKDFVLSTWSQTHPKSIIRLADSADRHRDSLDSNVIYI